MMLKIIEFLYQQYGDDAKKEFEAQQQVYENGGKYPRTWLTVLEATTRGAHTQDAIGDTIFEEGQGDDTAREFWNAYVELANIEDDFREVDIDSAGSYGQPAEDNIDKMRLMRTGITAAEAEKKYNLSTGLIRQYIRRGKFEDGEYTKIGNSWVVLPAAVERIINT